MSSAKISVSNSEEASSHHEDEALVTVLRRFEAELRLLGLRVDDFQSVLSTLDRGGNAVSRDNLAGLQSIDSIQQTLVGLADFIGQLTLGVPERWAVDLLPACAVLTLEELAARLSATGCESERPEPPGGDCEYF